MSLLSIEGNIGAGKSTLVRRLKDVLSVPVIQEPVDLWTSVQGENALAAYYSDVSRYAFSYQTFAWASRLRSAPSPGQCVVSERSVESDRHVFAARCIDLGWMNAMEALVYRRLYDEWTSIVPNAIPSAIVYLDVAPDVCFQRIKERARPEDSTIDSDFLQDLDARHWRWIDEVRTSGRAVQVIKDDDPLDRVADTVQTLIDFEQRLKLSVPCCNCVPSIEKEK